MRCFQAALLFGLIAMGFASHVVAVEWPNDSKPPTRGDQPNLLFIMVDDLGKDWIGCYGADDIKTPNIDALAASGLKFDNAWSMPQCTPTRATLLTGQYPWRTGWVNHWDVPRWGVGYFDWEAYTTFATILKKAGYKTAIAGKWQINDFRVEPLALEKHGFDDWCVWTGYEAKNPPSSKRYWDPYIHTRDGRKKYKGKFGPDLYCDFLVQFMEKHRDEPMMLYFPMALTHGPLITTPDELDVESKFDKHRAMVRYTDKLVGRLMDTLDRLELRKNTIVIFTTDNGSGGGVRGTIDGKRPTGGKASNFEGGVCQPFIVNGPGMVPAGKVTDALTDFSDLLPTFVELGGAKLPAGLTIDGKSIAPLLLGNANDSPRDWIMAMGYGPAIRDSKGVRGRDNYTDRVIRDKRFKVWVDKNKQIDAIYDLASDPYEQTNLIGSDDASVQAAKSKFQSVVDETPDRDARPRYQDRGKLDWDRPIDSKKKKASPRKSKTKSIKQS
ncbi:MAG: sulfatase-like hydrolase/transferase [Planctomycetota bacterium]